MLKAIEDSFSQTESIFKKSKFWQENIGVNFSPDQRKIINMLLDGFEGNLTSSKWAKICKCSHDTATRAIADLQQKDILEKLGAGRSTHYALK
jgi:Fic family protein